MDNASNSNDVIGIRAGQQDNRFKFFRLVDLNYFWPVWLIALCDWIDPLNNPWKQPINPSKEQQQPADTTSCQRQ